MSSSLASLSLSRTLLCLSLIHFSLSLSLSRSTKLGKGVKATLLSLLSRLGGLSNQEASEYMAKLIAEGRYMQDVWG